MDGTDRRKIERWWPLRKRERSLGAHDCEVSCRIDGAVGSCARGHFGFSIDVAVNCRGSIFRLLFWRSSLFCCERLLARAAGIVMTSSRTPKSVVQLHNQGTEAQTHALPRQRCSVDQSVRQSDSLRTPTSKKPKRKPTKTSSHSTCASRADMTIDQVPASKKGQSFSTIHRRPARASPPRPNSNDAESKPQDPALDAPRWNLLPRPYQNAKADMTIPIPDDVVVKMAVAPGVWKSTSAVLHVVSMTSSSLDLRAKRHQS